MIVTAIDPGPVRSAYVTYDAEDRVIDDFGIEANEDMLAFIHTCLPGGSVERLVIEKVESFGMAVGAEVFETVFWSGRFAEAAHPVPVDRIGRKAIKVHLCGSARAKDTNIRQALIDRFGGSSAIGTKAAPGPLYGIKADIWAALAVAVTYTEKE